MGVKQRTMENQQWAIGNIIFYFENRTLDNGKLACDNDTDNIQQEIDNSIRDFLPNPV